jgi:hypothetical protein
MSKKKLLQLEQKIGKIDFFKEKRMLLRHQSGMNCSALINLKPSWYKESSSK